MIDTHSHLLFQVDDGARSIEESLAMIDQYLSVGYKGCILTPHYDRGRYLVGRDLVLEKTKLLKDELEFRGIEFDLYPGNEVQLDEATMADLKADKFLKLNNTSYLLCELPFTTKPLYLESLIYEMQLEGIRPIIAHPERYTYIQKDPSSLEKLIKYGCLMQMNLSSILKEETRDLARDLLARNMVHLLGTDAHQEEWRSPNVSEELAYLRDLVGEEKFRILVYENPAKLVNNEIISHGYDQVIPYSQENSREKKWYEFWRKNEKK